MKNELIPFDFKGNELTVIVDEKGEPWWVAKEVCDILGLTNVAKAVKALDDDEKSYITRSYLGLKPGKPMHIINEPGLYRLISKSVKKIARVFQRWIFHDVLPSIRKTGRYLAELDYRTSAVELAKQVLEYDERQKKLEARVIELRPKAQKFEQLMETDGILNLRETAKALGVGPNKMTRALRKAGAFFKNSYNNNCPKQKLIDDGYFVVTVLPKRHDPFSFASQTFTTSKGLGWISDAIEKGLMATV